MGSVAKSADFGLETLSRPVAARATILCRLLRLASESRLATLYANNVELCTPALACCCYMFCSTALTLANKFIFSAEKLNYPWMLLGIQSVLVTSALSIYCALTRGHVIRPALLRDMFIPCALFTAYIFTNARTLRYISLPVLSVIKSLAPMGIAVAERAMFNERISVGTYSAMALIVAGNIATALNDIEFLPLGYIWAFCNVLCNILYVLSLRFCLSKEYSPLEKTIHSNLIAATCYMLPLAVANGEMTGFWADFTQTSKAFKTVYGCACILSAGIGASVFWVVQTSNGSTLSFAGASNKFLVVLLGAVLFQANISFVGWIGVMLGVVAGVLFTLSKARDAIGRAKSKGATLSNSFSKVDLENSDDDTSCDVRSDGEDDLQIMTSPRNA